MEFLKNSVPEVVFVDGQKLCAIVGTAKVLNVIMLGVAVQKGWLGFSREAVLTTMNNFLPKKLLDINSQALDIGCRFEEYL